MLQLISWKALTWHFGRRIHVRRGLMWGVVGDAIAYTSVHVPFFFFPLRAIRADSR